VDFLALKRLIIQQFQSDAQLVLPSEFADLILSAKAPGTTVKCDGEESDPYAFLSVVDLGANRVCT
jgi:protein BCP1